MFSCRRCGTCCHSLLEYHGPIRLGMALMPGEINLFPTVFPLYAKWREIRAYQIDEDTCPHWSEEGCAIYAKRPATCRAFPINEMEVNGRTITFLMNKCPVIQENGNVGFSDEFHQANRIILRAITNAGFVFDMESKLWLTAEKFAKLSPNLELETLLRGLK